MTSIPGSVEVFEHDLALHGGRADTSRSLTDCMSFAVMGQRGIDRAPTADLHFVPAGFQALLRE